MSDLQAFLADERFTTLDRSLARHLAAQASSSRWIGHAAALLSSVLRRGHLCLDLSQRPSDHFEAAAALQPWPSLSSWRDDLLASGLVVQQPGEFKPLVLDATGRLYLHRYYEYERDLAARIIERLGSDAAAVDPVTSADSATQTDMAIDAVRSRRFMVIAGGPGTGKTTTVVRILVALLTERPELRISLAAPTGKAAHRMQQSIAAQLASLPIDEALRERLPRTASTLHRLLGARGDSAFFRHDADRPLASDVVIVDESSMVDLPLMAKLFAALRPEARIILIGDPDQLASVEVGSVLADITAAGTALGSALVTLRKPWRFAADSGIGALCGAIRSGDADRTLEILDGIEYPDVTLKPLPTAETLGKTLSQTSVMATYRNALQSDDPAARLATFETARILCATRSGLAGTTRINETIRDLLSGEELIDDARGALYHGAPLVVLRNDYALQVFNGDSAVLHRSDDEARLHACFRTGTGELRRVLAARLPEHAPLYAMTVHRSQGSEFDHVLVVLPPRESPILTRELLYTAVSRARKSVTVWADPTLIRYACLRRVQRASGLTERLTT